MSGLIGLEGSKSGLVHKPVGNFIMAWATDIGDISLNGKVNFTSIEVDPDGCCDLSADTYTAPIDGVYLFWGNFYARPSGNFYQYFFINGVASNFMSAGDSFSVFIGAANDNVTGADGTGVLTTELNAGDTVYVNINGTLYSGHSCWGGSRIG